jgi:hypothetical protein
MNAEIEALIAEYNGGEAQQGARRKAIFELVRTLPSYHQVRFSSGDTWSGSLLHHADPHVIEGELNKHVHLITSWQ